MTDRTDSKNDGGSPLDFAIDQQSRVTMATVRRAVTRADAVLAYQPIVQAERPENIAFHEGLIRIIDETGRIIPLRDFMPLAETTELGRQIDCLALSLGLKALADEPSLRLSINMSARSIGYPAWLRTLRDGWGLSPFVLILVLLVFYIILGMVMEGLGIIVMTLPITLPLIEAAGYSKLWFGIFMVIVIEMAQISPPVGFNLTVIQRLTGDSMGRITRATVPFFTILALFVLLIGVFPGIIDIVPNMMAGR